MASSKVRAIVRVSSGNFLEMYDFMVFGYYAPAIGAAFFPSGNQFVSLMLALMTFGAGFLMRPLGAIVLGAYADKHGRRAGLVVTLSLMSVGIVSIACVPGYATIGILAPLLVLSGRLLQGFSAGHGARRRLRVLCQKSPRQGTKGSTWPGNPRASKPRWCSRRFSASC